MDTIASKINIVENYPSQGIIFRDISPLLYSVPERDYAFNALASLCSEFINTIDVVAGIDARGFIIGTAVAILLKKPFVMIRKSGKLPGNVIKNSYKLEYGSNTLEIQTGLIEPNQRCLIVDDVLITGGTHESACNLLLEVGAKVVGFCNLIEINGLGGYDRLKKFGRVVSLLKYDNDLTNNDVSNNKYMDNSHIYKAYADCENIDDNRIVIINIPSMENMANKICLLNPSIFRKGLVEWNYFPDKYPNIKFEKLQFLENKHVVFLGSLYDKDLLFEQVSLVIALARQIVKSLIIFYPYYAPGTMERVDQEGVLATAETMAKIVSNVPNTKSGNPVLCIYDIHALQERFYFTDNVTPKMLSATHLLINEIKSLKQKCNLNTIIVFPDDGAYKRFKCIFENYPIIVCAKIREGDKRTIKITNYFNIPSINDFNKNDHLLIVDDLVQSGTTLYECYTMLKNFGAHKISAYCTHAVFPNNCYSRFFPNNDREGFFKFYITDSIPETTNKINNRFPFYTLSLVDDIKNTVLGITKYKVNRALSNYNHISTKNIIWIIASTNTDKINAVELSVNYYYGSDKQTYSNIKHTYSYTKIESNVPNQPFNNEIECGVLNRYKKLVKVNSENNCFTENTVFVSIENGIILYNNLYYDIGCVCVGYSKNMNLVSPVIKYTLAVPVSEQLVQKSIDCSGSITVGEFFNNQDTTVSKSNWHTQFGYDRTALLKNALIEAYLELNLKINL